MSGSVTNIGWFTTAPHPFKKAHRHGADDGQIGWRLHAVPVDENGNPEKRAAALCGLRPRHGWGMDLFIDHECTRCDTAILRRAAVGEVFVDLPEERKAARAEAFTSGNNAAWHGLKRSANPHPVESHLHAEWLRGFDEESSEGATA